MKLLSGAAAGTALGGLTTGGAAGAHADATVGSWSCDEGSGDHTVEDVAGVSKHVEGKGDDDPLWLAGKDEHSLLLDGTTTWASWAADELAPEFSDELAELTIDAWVAPRSNGSNSDNLDTIIEKADRSAQEGFTFGVDKYGYWSFQVGLGDSWEEVRVDADDLIDVYEWNHLTGVFDGTSGVLRLYKDGVKVAERSVPTGTVTPASTALRLGRNAQMDYVAGTMKKNIFNGAVSQLETFDAALSDSEVQDKHDAEAGDLPATGFQDLTVNPRQFDDDNFRPEYHAIAPTHWMNEPHAPLYFDGKYHLFCQHNPQGPYWDHIHWGHWVSDDMVHWDPVKEALRPEEAIDPAGCWTGDATIDADGYPKLFYTAGLTEGSDDQAVATATSTYPDDGDSRLTNWTKQGVQIQQPDDPELLDNEFRDPHVWQENGEWYMLVGSGLKNDNGGTALAFHSTDSVNWEYKGRALQLDNPDDYPDLGDVWELPVLLPLGTDADGNEKHILCINPAKGDADMEVFYWIGEWDPANFTFTRDHQDPYLIDSGDSHFTGPSGFIDPARDHANFDPATDRSILFTIAQDFRKPHLHDNSGWAHNAGTPMELQLRDDGRLGINPIEEMTRARAEKVLEMHDASPGLVDDALENLTANTVELQLEIEPNQANEYGFYSHHSPGGEEKTLVYYDEKDGKIKTDRRDTSDDRTLMEEEENRSSLQTEGAVDIGSENLTLRVFIDKSLIECYVNSLHSVTTRAYPSRDDSTELRLYQAGPGDITVRSIEIWEMEDVQNGTTSGNGIVDGATYKITNRNSGKVLDVEDAGTSDGDYAVQWEWLGGANQKWVAHEVADGVYELENVNSGKVLDIEDAGTSDGDYAMQWESWGGDNQRWTIDRVGDGYHRVRNVNSGKVLDVEDAGTSDGDYAVQWEWWGGDNQQWQFERLD